MLGDGGDLHGDGVNIIGDGGNLLSIAGGSSKMTVEQKCSGAMEIQEYHLPTYRLYQQTDMRKYWRHLRV